MNSPVTINRSRGYALLPLVIALILSAFTHLLNPIGFPTQHGDEAHYLRRAMHVLDGLGPQETPMSDRPHDHPYFGQIFLASILGSAGYPYSILPSSNLQSIEMLYLIPRVLMGILAVVDTFLVYKIAERRYNRDIALIAAILFAIMPLSWFLRRIFLDSILLPFLLLSILFATNSKHKIINSQGTDGRESEYLARYKRKEKKEINKTDFLLVLLSGVFLGLAVFTKIPSISMVPLIGYMIFTGSKKNWKSLGLWLIPVILIPIIWPSYSLLSNEFTNWTNDVLWQGGREGSGNRSLYSIFNMDPILTLLGVAGLIFAIIKRDFLPILWIIPFMFFIEFIGFTQNFYWIMVLPAFCIASAAMIVAALKKISKTLATRKKPHQKAIEKYDVDNSSSRQEHNRFKRIYGFFMEIPPSLLSYRATYVIALVGLGIFGLTSTTMITIPFLNSNLFELYTFIVQNLPDNDVDISAVNSTENKVTIIGDKRWLAEFLWVPRYVLDKDLEFRGNFRTVPLSLKEPVETEKVLLIVDSELRDDITSDSDEKHIQQLQSIYINTTSIGVFEDSEEYEIVRSHRDTYPFTSMEDNRGTGKIEVRANY